MSASDAPRGPTDRVRGDQGGSRRDRLQAAGRRLVGARGRRSPGAPLGTAVLLLAAAVAAFLPVLATTFVWRPPAGGFAWRLLPAPVPGDGGVLPRTAYARSVDAVQAAGLAPLLGLLAGILGAAAGAALLTLLMAWAQRGLTARRGVAVRRALGQSPGQARAAAAAGAARLVAVALGAGALGGWIAARVLGRALPPALVSAGDAPSLLVAAALGAALAFLASLGGVLPTVPSDRGALRTLTVGDRATEDPALGFARRAVASAQVAVLVIAVGTILVLGRSMLTPDREGWTSEQASDTIVTRVSVDGMTRAGLATLHGGLAPAVARATGARAASVSSPGTLLGLAAVDNITTYCGPCVRGGLAAEIIAVEARVSAVSPGFFSAHDAAIGSGRGFAGVDGAVVVSEAYHREFDDGVAVGKRLLAASGSPTWAPIAGVAPDLPEGGFAGAGDPLPVLYLATTTALPTTFDVAVRGAPRGADVAAATRSALEPALEPGATASVGEPRPLEALLREADAPLRWLALLLAAAAIPGILLALAGMASGMAEDVHARTRELGIRAALGAAPNRLAREVLFRGVAIGLRGLAFGTFLFLAVDLTLRDRVPAAQGAGPAVYATLALLVVVVAVASTAGPARRIARSDPAETMARSRP